MSAQRDIDDTRHCPMCEDAAKKILELEQRVKVLTDGLQKISSIGKGIGNMMAKDLLNQTPQQTAAQIERGHIEWMMKLPVMARMIHRKNAVHGLLTDLARTYDEYGEGGWPDTWKECAKLVAIPPLPNESDSPETDLDEALRRR